MSWLLLIGIIILFGGGVIYAIANYKRLVPNQSRNPRSIDQSQYGTYKKQSITSRIQWENIETSTITNQIYWQDIQDKIIDPKTEPFVEEDFFNTNVPDDIDNILKNVVGTKDPLTQDIFMAGEKIYLCRRCRLAYHEESWEELNCKCRDCKSSGSSGLYTLPNLN